MKTTRTLLLAAMGLLMTASRSEAGVKLTALQIISTDATGKIQGVGGHRFKTVNHGGQPAIFLVKGSDQDGEIINGPGLPQNNIEIALPPGTHTYTVYAEKYNSYTWSNYTMNFHFDLSNSPQISAFAPLNTDSTDFFPAFTANAAFTEDLQGHSIKAPGTLIYKSGQTEVRVTGFHFSTPSLFKKDRVSPFEAKSNNTLDYVGEFTLEVSGPPEISVGGILNAASFTPKVAPGSLFSIFGGGFASTSNAASTVPLPMSLAGTSVTVGGKQAPLVFVSAGQINAQVPYEVLEGSAVPVVVTFNGVSSAPVPVTVVSSAPGIFQFGQKRAIAQNPDYSLNNTDNGAAPNSYMVAYLTGAGQPDNVVPTGSVAPSNPGARPRNPVIATVNGSTVEVAYAGLTADLIGVLQVNFKVPNMAPGNYPLVVTMNGEKSNAAMITIK